MYKSIIKSVPVLQVISMANLVNVWQLWLNLNDSLVLLLVVMCWL